MATQVPVARQVAWVALVPQLTLMACLAAAGTYLARDSWGIIAGIAVYLGNSFFARFVIARSHRNGMRDVKQHRYAEAISAFQRSYAYFSKHAWLDRYRSIALLSASAMSYREMALVNIAFCHSQLGQGADAKSYYQRTLAEFPNNGMAIAALKFIETFEH